MEEAWIKFISTAAFQCCLIFMLTLCLITTAVFGQPTVISITPSALLTMGNITALQDQVLEAPEIESSISNHFYF